MSPQCSKTCLMESILSIHVSQTGVKKTRHFSPLRFSFLLRFLSLRKRRKEEEKLKNKNNFVIECFRATKSTTPHSFCASDPSHFTQRI
ncbi:hypothetical protein MKW98_018485 [Papaver atlanticum]|uniref:Uncharacterized protein n=1 Tax=Papaver atlanticum TaxID=357466 RepID=A0AAD4THQ2_9MAGN|nr:hypothetical protein MKW98_018485 [Papaver atlanticum]